MLITLLKILGCVVVSGAILVSALIVAGIVVSFIRGLKRKR
jgi:hypothetical protein